VRAQERNLYDEDDDEFFSQSNKHKREDMRRKTAMRRKMENRQECRLMSDQLGIAVSDELFL
jgi:hypothetical protein